MPAADGALDVVHRLDEIVDAEGNRGDQDDSDELEARKDVTDGRDREREAEVRKGVADAADAQAAVAETEQVRSPGDDRARGDGDQAARHVPEITHAAEPVRQDDREADEADERRLEHEQAGPHRDEGDGNAGERAEQRRARRDLADDRRDEAARHQDETLDEHPGEACLPGLDGIVGPEEDRQHDDEGDDEHVRHADARRQGADVGAAGLLGQPIGEPGVVDRAEEQHQPEGGKNSPEHQRIRHLEHVAQQPGQHENVDEDVGAEPEEGVPVAGNPPVLRSRLGGHAFAIVPLLSFAPRLVGRSSSQPSLDHALRNSTPSRRCRPAP